MAEVPFFIASETETPTSFLLILPSAKLLCFMTFHPQTDGQTEIVNKALESCLRCFTYGKPKQWTKWLPWAEFCYNTTPHSFIRMSQFQDLYGKPPPHLVRFGHGHTSVDSVEHLLQERDAMLDEIRFSLVKAPQNMTHYANSKRCDMVFSEGNAVFLKLQPYRQHSLSCCLHEKLAPRYYGRIRSLKGWTKWHIVWLYFLIAAFIRFSKCHN